MTQHKLPVIARAEDYELHFNSDVWREAAATICRRHHLSYSCLHRSSQGENIIFFVDERYVIKIFAPFRENYLREKTALEFFAGKLDIETPTILYTGNLEGWSYLVMTKLSGIQAKEVWSEIEFNERLEIASHLGSVLKSLHDYAAPLSASELNRDWHKFIERQAELSLERQRVCGANPKWLKSLPAYISERLQLLPVEFRAALLHGDVHLGNMLLTERLGHWKISGLLDFGDSLCGFHEYDFVAPGVLMVQGSRELQRALLLSYGYRDSQLDMNLRARLMLLTVLYECSDLRKYALRLMPEALTFTLEELEEAIWRFAAKE